MNYSRARNPERLLRLMDGSVLLPGDLCPGPDGLILSSREAEIRFMSGLHHLRTEDLRPLLVIVGGFMDAMHGNAYSIRHRLCPQIMDSHDIYYREHPEARSAREVVEIYAGRGQRVTLVGHSWGADACVHGVAQKTTARIDLLVTLDPVSRKGAPDSCPASVLYWRNIYLDYQKVTWFNSSNNVARIGGPWERVVCAHENKLAPEDLAHNHGVALCELVFGEALLTRNNPNDSYTSPPPPHSPK